MKEVFEYIISLLKSRIFPMILIFIVLISVLVHRLFVLQIINGDSYVEDLSSSIQKDMSVAAARGRIYDRNGVLLAYNDLSYAVKISDSGRYSDNATKNATINNSINKTLQIIEDHGDTYSNDFPIIYNNGQFTYNVEGTSLLRFLRDSYGTESIAALTDEQKATSAENMFKRLCETYSINYEEFGIEHSLMMVNLRRYMAANSYNRYLTFIIANEVSDETVAAILENSDDLVGVTVEEQYIRRYVDSVYCSQILGYTGTVSNAELEELGEGYESNDIVGKSGIEKSMESELSGVKGEKSVYVDTVGRITEVLDEEAPQAGHDVYLTIDINLQKSIYHAIEDEVTNIFMQYFTPGSNKITYNSSGDVDTIYITAQEAYFALIDNNLVSLKGIQEQNTSNEADIYSQFEAKKAETLSWLREELTSGNTAYGKLSEKCQTRNGLCLYGKLSEEQKLYIWYIYDLLRSENIFSLANVDTSDSVYYDWIYGDSTSLSQLLTYGISKNWINMSSLTSEKYTSLQESYDVLVDYVISALDTDTAFFKKMYKYMINAGSISGRQVCMLLYEQGVLDMNADDSKYQSLASGSMGAYEFMSYVISNKIITVGQLALKPCSGSAVVTNPDNGDVLALVSYPSYDNNKLSGTVDAKYYSSLVNDNASPLLNRATQSFIAPGSTYKPCTIIAGIDSGIISSSTTFNCSGVFDKVTPSPRCWQKWGHGSETPVTAIRDSCNVYMYNVGYNLACSKNGSYNSTYGTNILKKYSDMLGLSTKTGIEIEEGTPGASSQNAIASAIGQGNHRYSTLNLARYVTTLATSGTCYNLTLIDKITDYDGNVIMENHAEVNNQVELSSDIWNTIHTGMNLAAGTYSAFSSLKMSIAAKTGTAQERTTDPDHATLISYAPYDNPQYCMAVRIQNGYASGNAVTLGSEIYKMLFNIND